MNTRKPISTISYNTAEFLANKISEWKKKGLIEFAMWIFHEADKDDAKEHFHVYIMPAKQIQTMDLEFDSQEIDPVNPKKPLKMITFRPSKEEDWTLYGIHDPVYLMEKGLTRNTFYKFEDIMSTDQDTLNNIIARITEERQGKLEYRILECINKGMSWGQIVRAGIVPIRNIVGARIYHDTLLEAIWEENNPPTISEESTEE